MNDEKYVHNYKNPIKLQKDVLALLHFQRIKANYTKTKRKKTKDLPNNIINKIPPINVCEIETKELISFLKNGLKIKEFKIREFRYKNSLFLNSINDYVKVNNHLEKIKAKFFIFTLKVFKNKTFLLKGLDVDNNIDEIFDELCKHEYDDLLKMVTNYLYSWFKQVPKARQIN